VAKLALSVTEFGPDYRGRRVISGRLGVGQAHCVVPICQRWPGQSGHNRVKTEATSLLHSFPTLSLSLALTSARARSNAAITIAVCLRHARSSCTQHRCLIHLAHISSATSSTTSNHHYSRSSLGKAPFRIAATAPSPECHRAFSSLRPDYSEAPPLSLPCLVFAIGPSI